MTPRARSRKPYKNFSALCLPLIDNPRAFPKIILILIRVTERERERLVNILKICYERDTFHGARQPKN
jgi:hypothetical protein